MKDTVFDERLRRFGPLTAREASAIAALQTGMASYRRGTVLFREHEPVSEILVIRQGWLYGSTLLPNGSRQILKLHMVGDVTGLSASVFPIATETVVALTDVVVATFDRTALGTLFLEHPRLAALLFVLVELDRVELTDRLAAMGRATARARVATLLLDMATRLRTVEPWTGATFTMPLTQEQIGDMIGLTAVHVNRMLRGMDREGLIRRRGQAITLLDEPRLTRIANYVDRRLGIEMDWLPPAR